MISKIHVGSTYAKATITIAAVAAVLAVALIAASPARAVCTPAGTPGGGSGGDVLCGTSASESLNGQAGDDRLFGGGGNDVLTGGTGFDAFSGESGNDVLLARDGQVDNVFFRCGSGTDTLEMDLVDAIAIGIGVGYALIRADCERIFVTAVNEGPTVRISQRSVSVGEDGRAAVRLRCPASLQAPCAGILRLGHSENSQGKRKHYSIDQGKKETVSARLSQRDRNKLSQRDRITALVTSIEQGQFGDKTTVQTIKLIAQG